MTPGPDKSVAEVLATDWQFEPQPADQRRGRHIVAVVGEKSHSGIRWHRLDIGLAGTVFEGRQGYLPEDIAAIERRGDMDPMTGTVVAWMDFITPPLPLERQGEECWLAFPPREAAAKSRGEVA